MPLNVAAEVEKLNLAGQNKTAVVVGATTGNSRGIALRLAQVGCERIIICADDKKQGREVLESLDKFNSAVQFVYGDLSDVKGMQAAVAALQEAAGDAEIDYLILSQIGFPTGVINNNSDGHDTAFSSQCIARFALPYLLANRGALAANAIVLSVYYHWGHSLDDLSVDDLSLKHRLGKQSTTNMYKSQTRRDCSVLDSLNEARLVKGDFSAGAFPTYLKAVVWLGSKTLAVSPEQYANVPVYILASPDAQGKLGAEKYFDDSLNPGASAIGNWARDTKNRAALWEKFERDHWGELK
ncbi:hypothetical protein C8R45DRAFT_1098366 [Mycena sanguinolenta]|nr:hypothetical protein C8R45DRAFT_1098366 [Mycena sanguinolenta]